MFTRTSGKFIVPPCVQKSLSVEFGRCLFYIGNLNNTVLCFKTALTIEQGRNHQRHSKTRAARPVYIYIVPANDLSVSQRRACSLVDFPLFSQATVCCCGEHMAILCDIDIDAMQ